MDGLHNSVLTDALRQMRTNNVSAQQLETAKDFEAVFLTQFVDEMMKTAGSSTFGSEHQAEMWRSFMSEAVAKHLVEQGGVGLSTGISQMIDAYEASPQSAQALANAEVENDPSYEISLR